VALVNDAPFPGGECLWRGCIPSKAWRHAADRMRDRAQDARLGVVGTDSPTLQWSTLEATRRSVLDGRGEAALKTDRAVKVTYVRGRGAYVDAHTLLVDERGASEDAHRRGPLAAEERTMGRGDTRRITFGATVIATGAPPWVPPIPGAAEGLQCDSVLTSDTVWALPERPGRLVIIGCGAIGAEMAQIFADFGSEVLVLEARDRILAEVDEEIGRELAALLCDDPRIEVKTQVRVLEIAGEPGAVLVRYLAADGTEAQVTVDRVLAATGKRPRTEGLGLDVLGVTQEGPAIAVDDRQRTNVPHVYAVGDVVPGFMLAHTAAQQGRVAASQLLGHDLRYDETKDCGVIFTRPQAAFVGLSMAQAKARGIEAAEVKAPMRGDAKAQIAGEVHGQLKLVADVATRRIIGAHLLADHADTLVGEAVLMVGCGLTLEQVGAAIHPHPTQTEMWGELARRLQMRLQRRGSRT
jgi:dihydrolipoamide dehydrogenase